MLGNKYFKKGKNKNPIAHKDSIFFIPTTHPYRIPIRYVSLPITLLINTITGTFLETITMPTEEEQKKKERKEKLKAEAEKLGISYKELKEQKKAAKEKRKRNREADVLVDSEHKDDMKRMRTWSHDEKDPEADQNSTKRRRTRSMDAKEEQETAAAQKADMSPAEWRKDQHITIRGHGKYDGKGDDSFPNPFLKFSDAPFNANVLRSFDQAGFTAPTAIQSQVRIIIHSPYNPTNFLIFRNFF